MIVPGAVPILVDGCAVIYDNPAAIVMMMGVHGNRSGNVARFMSIPGRGRRDETKRGQSQSNEGGEEAEREAHRGCLTSSAASGNADTHLTYT